MTDHLTHILPTAHTVQGTIGLTPPTVPSAVCPGTAESVLCGMNTVCGHDTHVLTPRDGDSDSS
jgi:hypothetical protein